jgi:glyoxylase-like metal-dependent hydrolase (beta-lactamase superfamily II)/rhodanese-related sulfurtransferase
MLFRQILHEDLGCASYVVADAGEAAVVDPKWEIQDYLELAREHDLRIVHILETHNHADHLSGHGRLAAATGATIHAPAAADAEYEHEPLEDGSVVEVGAARIVALRTAGHRPEHTAFLVEDRDRAEAPWLVLTGDSLLVGDIARPDLAVEPEEGARELRRSLDLLLELDDFLEVWPGHIGGSLCGGSGMSEKPGSTLGFERRFNRLLTLPGEDFTRELTADPTPQPPNFRLIVELNRGPLLTETAPLEPLAPARAEALLRGGAVLLDGRSPREFDAAHVPGSINVTATESGVGTRAAWILDPDEEVVVVGRSDAEAAGFARKLEAVAFRRIRGFLSGGIPAWQAAGLPAASTPALDPHWLAERLRRGDVTLVDVRDEDEWRSGHVEASLHVPYREFRKGLPDELSQDEGPLAVACSAGNRSSLAASLLERAGRRNVIHVADGGIEDLERLGIPLVRDG